jgi:glycosyltransferase involved in cell wall biosynthesis
MLWLLLRGHDPGRIAPSVVFLQHGAFAEETRALGIPTAVIDAGRIREVGRGARAIGRLARIISRARPDVVFSWMGKTHLYAGPAAALARRSDSTAWWLHDIPSATWVDRVTQAVPAAAVGSSSAIGARTLDELRPLRATFVVRPGVEDFLASGSETLRTATRERLGVAAHEVVVALIGRFHPQKGQDRFVEALELLHGDGVPFHGLLVGGSIPGQHLEFEAAVMQRIADSGLSASVTQVDHVDEPWGYLLASDVYVNARVRENLSLGILEAACAGRAIVGVASGGTPEILEDGVSGVLLKTPDPASIAAAVRRLVEDHGLRSRLGTEARQLYERRFTATRMVDELQDAMARIGSCRHERR